MQQQALQSRTGVSFNSVCTGGDHHNPGCVRIATGGYIHINISLGALTGMLMGFNYRLEIPTRTDEMVSSLFIATEKVLMHVHALSSSFSETGYGF
jgi:hypothetical protein